MERQLQTLIIDHRKQLGFTTIFDDNLSYLLSSALSSYEMERVVGTTVSTDDFQQSIKHYVTEGHTFLGLPIQFSHRSPTRIMLYLLKAKIGISILECRGDHVRHALRCKIYAYPENTTSVWICLASTHVSNE